MHKLLQKNDNCIARRRAVIGALFIMVPFLCNHSLASGSDGLVIAQSGIFSGETTTYLKPLVAIKVVRQKSNMCFISTAPKWDIILTNTKTKTWCHLTNDTFKGPINSSAMLILTGQNVEKLNWIKHEQKATTMFGIPVLEYQSSLVDTNTGQLSPHLKAILFVMKDDGIPKTVASAACRFLAFRCALGALPLKIVYPKHTDSMIVMHTTSVQHRIVKNAEFEVPQGFTKVANEQSVVRDIAAQDAIEQMVNSMGGK
jgi:hypothetical protein